MKQLKLFLFFVSLTMLSAKAQVYKKNNSPVILEIGNLKGSMLQIDSFRLQKKLNAGPDLNVVSCKMFFTGTNFANAVIAMVNGSFLLPSSDLLKKCVPGTILSIENLIATNKKGDTFYLMPRVFTFYKDAAEIHTNKTAYNVNTIFNQLRSKQFVTGTIYFSGNAFPKITTVSKNEFHALAILFNQCTPGSIITFDNCTYLNTDGTASKPFTQTLKLE